MQLTRFSDYSLRVLIFLAHRQESLTTIKAVADAHGISKDHLTKVVQRLSKLGYIRTVRGKNGGIGAVLPAAGISIGQVLRHLEPAAPVECFLSNYDRRCILYPSCALRGALQSAQLQFFKTLDAYTVADVMGPSRPVGTHVALTRLRKIPPSSLVTRPPRRRAATRIR